VSLTSHQSFLVHEAVDLVHEVFNLGARSVKKEDITLCFLSSHYFGYDQQVMWASIIPREWEAIVRPHINEVGVLLAQGKDEWGGMVSLGERVRKRHYLCPSAYIYNRCWARLKASLVS